MRCKTCHYSLEHLTEHRCPECGRAFDPKDPKTFDIPQSLRTRLVEWHLRHKLFVVGGLMMVLGQVGRLIFDAPAPDYRNAGFLLLGVLFLCTGIYGLTRLKR